MTSSIDVIGGARPNFVKLASLWPALQSRLPPRVSARLIHTGQHYAPQLASAFARGLGLPDWDDDLGVGSGTHAEQTAAMLVGYERLLLDSKPRPIATVVVGDVNSTLACALAAAKLGVPVVHVEAGLRAFDRTMPEEINRIMTDALSELLLASEPSAVDNLRAEGVAAERMRLVGSLIVDSVHRELPAARALRIHESLGVGAGEYAFVTLHRPTNVDDAERLKTIVGAIEEMSASVPVIFALHPRTAKQLEQHGLEERLSASARVIRPQAYRSALALIDAARVVITDSGGIQEETTALGVPCLTLRSNTERPATLALGTNRLVPDPRALPGLALAVEGREQQRAIEGWDGNAAQRAADAIAERFL